MGGFGLGSQFAWQTIGLIDWEFPLAGERAHLYGDYRALGQDYEEGSFEWEVTSHGFLLGFQLTL